MAKVKVDYSDFQNVIRSVEAYINSQKNNMRQIQLEINNLNANWKGKDFEVFKIAMENLNTEKAATKNLQKSLEDYVNILKATENEYKTAQQKALDLANKI